jgi:hypothetical protein
MSVYDTIARNEREEEANITIFEKKWYRTPPSLERGPLVEVIVGRFLSLKQSLRSVIDNTINNDT